MPSKSKSKSKKVDKTFESSPVKEAPAEDSGFIKFCKDNSSWMQWVCMAGIFACHSNYAYYQETLLGDKTLKLDVSMVLIFQNVIAILISGAIILMSGQPGGITEAFTLDDLIVSFFNFGSMNFSNRAMKVVSYPFVVLCKSAKIIPVMLVGSIRGVYKLETQQYFIAVFITIGLLVFNMGKMKTDDQELNGLGYVFASLLFDGMTQTQTDKQHKKSKRSNAYPTMFTNNCFGLSLSLLMYTYSAVVNGEDTHIRMMNDSTMFTSLVIIGLCGTLGQVFIFFTVTLYDCYLLTIITTTRKFFSVFYSNFKFGHNFTTMQWVGSAIVMACTVVELTAKKSKKKDGENGEIESKKKQ